MTHKTLRVIEHVERELAAKHLEDWNLQLEGRETKQTDLSKIEQRWEEVRIKDLGAGDKSTHFEPFTIDKRGCMIWICQMMVK